MRLFILCVLFVGFGFSLASSQTENASSTEYTYANPVGIDPSNRTYPGALDIYKVGASDSVFTTQTQDRPFTFTASQSLSTFLVSFYDSAGNLTCGDPINGDLYLTDLSKGKSIIYAQDATAFEGGCLSTYSGGHLSPYFPPIVIPPDVLNELLGELLYLSTCECTSGQSSPVPACTGMSSPIPINVMNGSGRYHHSFTDLAIPTQGLPLVLARVYNSDQQKLAPQFGWNWSFQQHLTIEPNSGTVYPRLPSTPHPLSQ